jgi:uncharacterized protein with ParB-like and HNH nuclease domain
MKQLQSLDDVFNKKLFRIPDYQRGYAWGKKQLIEFWEDLVSLRNRDHYTGVLYIKSVQELVWKNWNDERWLIEKRNYVPYFIVDGQQRLTTISILLQCLIEYVEKLPKNAEYEDNSIYLGSYKLKEIKEKFIVISQPPENIINTYKFGYETKNPSFEFLRYNIFNEQSAGTINETFYTLNLENAKLFFQDNIKVLVNEFGVEMLEKLYEKITHKLKFNVYEISDDFNVFVAFETINNRGKSLSDLELLKNRLIYLTTLYDDNDVKEDIKIAVRKNINDAWAEIYLQLGKNKNHPLNDDDFLRAHWIMYFKYSRKKGDDYIRFLLDEEFSQKKVLEKVEVRTNAIQEVVEIKELLQDDDEINEIDDVFVSTNQVKLPISEINDYVLSLKVAAKHWYNSYNPENNNDLEQEERIHLDRLNRIGMAYFRPLILASLMKEDILLNDRVNLLKAIEKFIFLCFRVSRAMSNYKSSVYYGAARDLYKGNSIIKDILLSLENDLKWCYTDENKFKISYFNDFIYRKFKSGGTGFYGWNGLRYFLFEYEEYLRVSRGQPKISWSNFTKSDNDKFSIEHIFPQTATHEKWTSNFRNFTDFEIKCFKGSIGNLLALSSSINSSLLNDWFEDKKRTKIDASGNVSRNGYSNGSYSEQEVAQYSDWSPAEILERGLKLLQFMEYRWGIDLGDKSDKLKILHLDFINKYESNILITE